MPDENSAQFPSDIQKGVDYVLHCKLITKSKEGEFYEHKN
jgi:hypothetical protein